MKLTRTRVKVDANTAAAVAVGAATANTTHRVISYFLVAAGTVTVKWQSNTTDLTGVMSMILGVPFTQGACGCLISAPGEALNLTLGGAVQVSGFVEIESERTSD